MSGKQSGVRLQIEVVHLPDCLETALFVQLVLEQAGDGAGAPPRSLILRGRHANDVGTCPGKLRDFDDITMT